MKHVLLNAPIAVTKTRIQLIAVFFSALTIFCFSTNAFSQDSEPYELEHDLILDGVIAGAGVGFVALAEFILKEPFAHETCVWCNPPGFDHSIRDSWKWSSAQTPILISDITQATHFVGTYSFMAFVGYQSGRSDFIAQDLILITESIATTLVLTNIIKWMVGRERPSVHYESDGLSARENNLSFFSGHSALAASLTAASTTLAYLRGYDEAPWLLGIGGTIALATAYLRVAGDAHYFSDVVTGLIFGGGLGVAIPLLFHGRKTEAQTSPAISIGPSSVNFVLDF